VFHQESLHSPIIKIELFKSNMVFAFSNLAALIHYSATFGIAFLMSLYLQDVRDYSAQIAGLILVAQPLVMAIGSPIAGKLSDQFEPQYVASMGMALTAIGLLCLTQLNHESSIFFIVCILIGIGMGYALFSSPNTNAVMSSISPKYYGVAAATIGTMRLLGQMLSMSITIMILSNVMGKIQITTDNLELFISSIAIIFTIFFIMCVLGFFSSMARGKIHQRR